jgi:hypothetical protein
LNLFFNKMLLMIIISNSINPKQPVWIYVTLNPYLPSQIHKFKEFISCFKIDSGMIRSCPVPSATAFQVRNIIL